MVLFLVFAALTSARHRSVLSIWRLPLVTHGYVFDPHSPVFPEDRGPSCGRSTVLIVRPRQATSKLEKERLYGKRKKEGMLHVCSSSNTTLQK